MKNEIPAEALEQMQREGWATMEEQEQYWLNQIEATTDWFDHLRHDGRNPDGTGESYAERNR